MRRPIIYAGVMALLFSPIAIGETLENKKPDLATPIKAEPLTFKSFHDPGWLLLKHDDGAEIQGEFSYHFIKYEDISQWEPGEVIYTAFKPGVGSGIWREKTKAFYKVGLSGSHPIDILFDRCQNDPGGHSTAGTTGCMGEQLSRWDTEYDFYRADIIARSDDKNIVAKLDALDKAWVLYKDTFFELMREQAEQGGSIWSLILGSHAVGMRKDRVGDLISIYYQ